MDRNDCYATLGVDPGASMAEIRQAYRDLVLAWHPDRFPEDRKARAEERLKTIIAAYQRVCAEATSARSEDRTHPGSARYGPQTDQGRREAPWEPGPTDTATGQNRHEQRQEEQRGHEPPHTHAESAPREQPSGGTQAAAGALGRERRDVLRRHRQGLALAGLALCILLPGHAVLLKSFYRRAGPAIGRAHATPGRATAPDAGGQGSEARPPRRHPAPKKRVSRPWQERPASQKARPRRRQGGGSPPRDGVLHCTSCGRAYRAGGRFCTECGAGL